MPRKRQREDEEDSLPGSSLPLAQQAKRKRRILNYDPHDIIHELYDTIRTHKTEDGRLLCESFIRVPKRRAAADYYDVVTTPIDLLKIQQKVKTDSYDYVDQLSADVMLMVNNAKAYYKKTSQEFRDACDLMELYEVTRADLVEAVFGSGERSERLRKNSLPKDIPDLPDPGVDADKEMESDDEEEEDNEEDDGEEDDEEDEESESGDKPDRKANLAEELAEDLEQLFAAIVTTKDGDRDISQAFQLLPPSAKYPQYYEVIKSPIDLKMIATKIQQSEYANLDDLERDLLLMVKNAKTFNEPKSLIYRDAVTLQRIIGERKRELEYKKAGQAKGSGRLKSKERNMIQKMSAVCAALKYQSEEDDGASSSQFDLDSEAETMGGANTGDLEEDDPQWILYNHVKNYIPPNDDEPLSEPFMKLPSKKFYPDYYKEIRRPMSLHKIRCKIEMNKYGSLLDLAKDFHLTFENAKLYNQDESQLYKDAVELQQTMMDKLRELDHNVADELLEVVELEQDDEDESRNEEPFVDDDASTSSTPVQRPRARKTSVVLTSTPDSDKKKVARKSGADDTLKKRLRSLYHTVFDYSDINGRLLRPIFMVLPSRKDYPDYYQVIMEPIDMNMIDGKLKADKYHTEQALLSDFELMFNNARHYNEEGSQLYQDANTLDKVLKTKWKSMAQVTRTPGSRGKSRTSEASPLSQKLQELYESVRDYQDRSGRALSSPFIKLPNKADYPDYYEVIKRPMDMQRIQQKMLQHQYEAVEEMVADFVQMFDNACKYNEPESVLYKDALTLQRVCFQKKLELLSDCITDVPDVRALTQELMKNLFISTFNHEDDEGRCYSDCFAELIEKDKALQLSGELTEKPVTFDQIKKNLDKGRYRRVDRFQEDMFKVFERARKYSRLDSQLYEDAVEMQKFFIKTRDELCKNGELLLTPALSYMERHLSQALEAESKSKGEQEKMEKQEEEEKPKDQADSTGDESKMEVGTGIEETDCEYKGQIYTKGDFVYIASRDSPDPHIMVIESFDKDEAGQTLIKGSWFHRPGETYHLATRKFLEKEVFKSDTCRGGTTLSEIVGRCWVMFVKDYFKNKPEGIPEKDVYVCESRYIGRGRCFKKIKVWNSPVSKNQKFVPREIPLAPTRVASMFAEKPTSENSLDESDTVIDKKRESVPTEPASEDGNTHYDQYVADNGCFKLGDGVYINNPNNSPIIARIDKIWTDSAGEAFFHYVHFERPAEVEHPLTRLFYKKEVFQASLEDCALIKNIVGKCCVLHYKDYCTGRPTEVPEQDVYINECKYMDADKSIKKQKLLKKYTLSPKVVDDEIYFFRKQIGLQKEASPLLMKASAEDSLYVDTVDSPGELEPETVNDSASLNNDTPSPAPTKVSSKKVKAFNPRRLPSGYIVFAGEARKQICQDNPSCSFGDISKLVGTKWRALSKAQKDVFEERARKIAEEMAAAAKSQEAAEKAAAAASALNESTRSQSPWSDSGVVPPPGLPMPGLPPPHSTPGQSPGLHQSPPSPVFVSVPPRSQKLNHSEVYIRYIENLSNESPHISDWGRTLKACQDNTATQAEAGLPGHWLAQGAGCHGNVTNALWALRDFMLKDALSLSRTVPFDDL